jgi:hypothetical protein
MEAIMPKNDRYVTKHPDGWAVKGANADKASSIHTTQKEAESRAKQIVSNLGGGEVRIQNKQGKWRDSDTVSPGNDPYPPKDKKH